MLTFEELRRANRARVGQFKNKHGQLAHTEPDGSDWSPAQWLQALTGELGEYANLRKKYERGDLTAAEFEAEAAKELADVQTYLDLLAQRCLDNTHGEVHCSGIDLGKATAAKFNEVSRRVGVNVFLEEKDFREGAEQSIRDMLKIFNGIIECRECEGPCRDLRGHFNLHFFHVTNFLKAVAAKGASA